MLNFLLVCQSMKHRTNLIAERKPHLHLLIIIITTIIALDLSIRIKAVRVQETGDIHRWEVGMAHLWHIDHQYILEMELLRQWWTVLLSLNDLQTQPMDFHRLVVSVVHLNEETIKIIINSVHVLTHTRTRIEGLLLPRPRTSPYTMDKQMIERAPIACHT